ncbi:hypothetical protein E4U41_004573 [Claviceps citrina]|nr:hypothetical protein E4U41_004573 [Claviceps citrina]
MGRFLPLFLSVVGTLSAIGVSGESAADCIGRCTGQVRDRFNDLQCPNASAAPCFCKNPTFSRAILECSQSCGANMDMISGYLASDFCKGQELAKPGEPAPVIPPASPTPSLATTSATSTITVAQTTPSSLPMPTPSSTTSQVESTSSILREASQTSSASSSTTSETAASATSSTAAAAGPVSTGLSEGAIFGITAGGLFVVISVMILTWCCKLGSKIPPDHPAVTRDISRPMPGSGRTYANREDHHRAGRDGSFEKYGPDIEMTANRYEDMVPRTQPRTMV